MYDDLHAREVPARMDTCSGPSALWVMMASYFPHCIYLPVSSPGPHSLMDEH